MQKMQSAYIPTTEEVRGAYEGQLIKVGNNAYQLLDEAHAKAEFDRWLAEVKADAWEEGQLALLEYMGVPLYPSKGDEPRNPKQPRNPYRQGENSKCLICDTPREISWN